MASQYPPTRTDIQGLTQLVHTLKVRDLTSICVAHGLSKSGVKADLQQKITELITRTARSTDGRAFEAIKRTVHRVAYPDSPYQQAQPTSTYHASSSSSAQQLPNPSSSSFTGGTMVNSYGSHNGHYGVSNGQRSQPHSGLQFKSSPFYEMDTLLGDVKTCDVMTQHRNSITISVKVNTYHALQRCITDSAMRVMIFCAASNTGLQDIAFPHQCELKVNGGEVKANLRGIKNKPGSTRPVDITDLLRLKPPTYSNTVEFIYALTNKGSRNGSARRSQKFYLALYLCRSHQVPTLVNTIERRHRISKAAVIQELTQKAQDPDIVATSQVLSLKCPLSYMRLDLPVRSMSCKHIQCFDATSYLQLQEQGPQWLCPICNQPAPFENLAVDEYVRDILTSTPRSQETVTIEPDGRWHSGQGEVERVVSKEEKPEASYIDDDDDGLYISDVNYLDSGARSLATPTRSAQTVGTPNTGVSREGSSMPKASSSNKRPIAEVIDLTLSDDDEPPRPTKRPNLLNPINGHHLGISGLR